MKLTKEREDLRRRLAKLELEAKERAGRASSSGARREQEIREKMEKEFELYERLEREGLVKLNAAPPRLVVRTPPSTRRTVTRPAPSASLSTRRATWAVSAANSSRRQGELSRLRVKLPSIVLK